MSSKRFCIIQSAKRLLTRTYSRDYDMIRARESAVERLVTRSLRRRVSRRSGGFRREGHQRLSTGAWVCTGSGFHLVGGVPQRWLGRIADPQGDGPTEASGSGADLLDLWHRDEQGSA